MIRFALVGLLSVGLGTAADAASYVQIDFVRNSPFPSGVTPTKGEDVTGNQSTEVPFDIPMTGSEMWSSGTVSGTATLMMTPNLFGVDKIYTLMNTAWGQTSPSYTSVTFEGSGGLMQTFELFGNVDIRDYNQNNWTNSINGTTTVAWWDDGQTGFNANQRLDMQIFDLLPAFESATLTKITVTDTGRSNFHRAFLTGVTAEIASTTAVPLPPAAGLLVAGVAALGAASRRRARI